MKHLLFGLFLLLAQIVCAQQTIENPSFKVRTGSILTIKRIDRSEADTRLSIHVIFRPHWWIKISSNIYIEDTTTGEKYNAKGIEGMEFDKETYLPDSGEMDIKLIFPPLPSTTTCINLIDPEDPEGKTYEISLLSNPSERKNNLAAIQGNWISQDGNNEWVAGFYDSLVIYRNQFWKYESIKKKGKRFLVTLRNESGNCSLTFKPQKNNCFLISGQDGEVLCGLEENHQLKPNPGQDDTFTDFFRTDTVYLQGYLQGYDPILDFSTGMIYIGNELTREDYPTVVTIHPDGRFDCKFVVQHPVTQNINILKNWIPFYVEPGQRITVYIDYEALLEKNRSREFYYPVKRVRYMGETANICQNLLRTNNLFQTDYQEIEKARKELTPEQFTQKMTPVLSEWLSTADSIIKADNYSAKSAYLLRNSALVRYTIGVLDYAMMRNYYAAQDTSNQVLKVKITDAFYNFLKQVPLNDETLMACPDFSIFINRFEYMEFFNSSSGLVKDDNQVLDILFARDSANNDRLKKYFNLGQTPVMWQVALVRSLNFNLEFLNNKEKARQYLQETKKYFSVPLFAEEGERLYDQLYSEKNGSYSLPDYRESVRTFRRITDKYKGKYVLVDFWATTCGPCRSGIEYSAELRKKYRDSPDVKFVFITGESESPENDYNEYVEKNLKDEDCYRIPDKDYHHLRELFRFNGIPHYETLNREGRVLRKGLSYWEFESRLNELLKTEKE